MREKTVRRKKRHIGLKIFGIALLCMAVSAAAFLVYVAVKSPDISAFDAVPEGYRTSVLDDQGNVVLNLSEESSNRVYVKLEETPADLQHAFVAIEDERFYTHHGVDVRGILRAFLKGVKERKFTEGASTITQQLLKNNVFTAWTDEQTFRDKLERKVQEQYLAVKLEMRVSKDWILENYLNTINLGGGNWGVETASRYYFGKDVSDLNLSECAVLAAITRNPTTFNPLKNPEKNRERRDLVLSYMLDQGYIDEGAYTAALADNVYERIAEVNAAGTSDVILDYFQDAMVYEVLDDLIMAYGLTEEEAWNQIYRGGLTIYSTQDSQLQAICEDEVNEADYPSEETQMSVVMLDSSTGEVKALVGGRGEKTASLILNRALTSTRQPASTIKVIGEYAAALENGTVTLGTAMDDAEYTYSDGTAIHNASGAYGGMTLVSDAISQSNNILALKCFQKVGMGAVWNALQNFGISTLTEADKVEALAIGGTNGGVTNMEMTAAYSSLARGGRYIEPTYYTKVLDREGNVLLENTAESHQAVSEETAALLTAAMEEAMVSGTGTKADIDNMTVAGKSGTSTDVRDAWFIGYSPYLTCGIWGGCDNNAAQESSTYVQTAWHGIMEQAHASLTDMDFPMMSGLMQCEICSKCGNLAVKGLCDSTEQGDMTETVWFAPGTQPTQTCTCHEKIEVCTVSGQLAGNYCKSTEERVYLKNGTAGTADEGYVIPISLLNSKKCEKHAHFWSSWFDDKQESGGDSGAHWRNRDSGRDGSSPEENSGYPDSGDNGSDSGDGYSFTDPDGGIFDGPDADVPGTQEDGETEEYWWDRLFSWLSP